MNNCSMALFIIFTGIALVLTALTMAIVILKDKVDKLWEFHVWDGRSFQK